MSSAYVRELVKTWVSASPTQFYDTLNFEVAPTDTIWFTVEYEVETFDKLTFCQDMQEDGVIDLVFCRRAGGGSQYVVRAAEAEGKRLLTNSDAKLLLKYAMPPEEFSEGDADPWYRVVVGIVYEYHP